MDDARLIAHLRAKHEDADTSGFSVLDFVSAFGCPLDALMYGRLFWPRFVEHRGVITLESLCTDAADRSRIENALLLHAGEVAAAEKSINTIEIPSFLFARGSETSAEEDRWLAEMLATSWECALQRQYPDRAFEVEVLEAEDGLEVCVCFHQCR